jgi:transitional endoplasmic reticulum ATPase
VKRIVTKGDIFTTALFGEDILGQVMRQFSPAFALGEIKMVVKNTRPDDIVIITEDTEIEVNPEGSAEQTMPIVTYDDIGGLGETIGLVREMVELPLKHPELFDRLGIDPPKGVLLHGPPGCGKTLLARAVAHETNARFFSISGPEILDKFYGESERRLRKLFDQASEEGPSIIFIDEIDSIAGKREGQADVSAKLVSQLLACMDGLSNRSKVIVMAATNRPDVIDMALRRPGRFDREIEIVAPDRKGRKEILTIHTRGMPLAKDVDLDTLVNSTHGFVGADLAALCREAAMATLRKILPKIDLDKPIPKEIIESLTVNVADFKEALKRVEPSAMREVFLEIPNVTWKDVGGLADVQRELQEATEWPLKEPERFKEIGVDPPKGILLIGPPGCGKTLLAKAVANESEANFITIRGPEIFSKWVGESERAVRAIFHKARQVAPAIIFFDELDAIAPIRGSCAGSHVYESVLNQLLAEMDGMEEMRNVIVIGATNRPDVVDAALLRPGRFDRIIMVPPPDFGSRKQIFKVHTKKMKLDKDINFDQLAKSTEGFSGADIANVCREAGMMALREKATAVTMPHLLKALEKSQPSIDPEMVKHYQDLGKQMSHQITKQTYVS